MIHLIGALLARASARGDDLMADFKAQRREHHLGRAEKYDASVTRRRARAAKSREGADTLAPRKPKVIAPAPEVQVVTVVPAKVIEAPRALAVLAEHPPSVFKYGNDQ